MEDKWVIDDHWHHSRIRHKCQRTVSRRQKCGKPAHWAILQRHGTGVRLWYYCEEHMAGYERKIVDGQVWKKVLVFEKESDASGA